MLAIVLAGTQASHAKSETSARPRSAALANASPIPLKLVVSIRQQRLTVWQGAERIAQSPISSGMSGHETPTGVFSILEKNREHFSNLYNDAPMPFMQRLTWSGVAFHAGALPGYPASHGCIRLPYVFARQLFEMTKVGARVIVARDDVEPRPFEHPRLPVPLPPAEADSAAQHGPQSIGRGSAGLLSVMSPAFAAAPAGRADPLDRFRPQRTRASVKAARDAELATFNDAVNAADIERGYAEARAKAAIADARQAAEAVEAERQTLLRLTRALETARRDQVTADDQIRSFVERNAAAVDQSDTVRMASLASTEDALENHYETLGFEVDDLSADIALHQRDLDRLTAVAVEAERARQTALDALAPRQQALEKARKERASAERMMQRRNQPITVFVSRKTGKLHVRQGFEPLFDAAVEFDHPDAPLGTHVFTALDYEPGERALRWNVVSLAPAEPAQPSRSGRGQSRGESTGVRPANLPTTPQSALGRLNIPDDVMERLAEFMRPGSTLMISDLDMSNETGKGTDFVLLTR